MRGDRVHFDIFYFLYFLVCGLLLFWILFLFLFSATRVRFASRLKWRLVNERKRGKGGEREREREGRREGRREERRGEERGGK